MKRYSTRRARSSAVKNQKGGMTIFAAVVLLSLMTLMLVYASRTQMSEQRISANEYQQKLAFHAAETGVEQALEYMLANSARVLSASPAAAPDGSGGTRPGWYNDGARLWTACPANPGLTHPCGGELAAGNGPTSFFYDNPATGTAGSYDFLPLSPGVLPQNSTFRVTAIMCQLDFDNPAGGCLAAPAPGEDTSESAYVLTLMAYGYADCSVPDDLDSCLVQASVSLPMTNFNFARGTPAVPLTTKTSFPPTGTAEIVPNPNAGGVGVPVSVWANKNPACSTGDPLLGSGNWATCEYSEWYEADVIPGGMDCGNPSCSCAHSEALSYTIGLNDQFGIDLLEDDNFPCDLFEFYFGVPRSEYQLVKSSARVIGDCSRLDENSYGIYWVTGEECNVGANTTLGSAERPIMLVSAAHHTRFTGGAKIYGVVFVTDVENPDADWDASGNNIIYGSAILDAELDSFVGTFQIIWNEDASLTAARSDGLGALSGGWRDFGMPDLRWEG
jgi:hypothetical protein